MPQPSIALITGGTGFVGRHLLDQLDSVAITSRHANTAERAKELGVQAVYRWHPTQAPIELDNAPPLKSVVNLMGEPIAPGRWTQSKKDKIRDSRVIGTRNLVEGLIQSNNLPDVLVSASAVGIYGDCGDRVVDEQFGVNGFESIDSQTPSAIRFLHEVCENWESEANRLRSHGVRVVNLRIGLVLGRDGGALENLVPVFRWGLGGKLGSGQQWMPWIHVGDLVSLIRWCIEYESLQGPVNAVAPEPVRNTTFTRQLARALKRPALLPVPRFALRVALGEFAQNLFASQRVAPQAALDSEFRFAYPTIEEAFGDLFP